MPSNSALDRPIQIESGQAVLAFHAKLHRSAQQMCHQLLAVADAQHVRTALSKMAGSTVGLAGS